MEVEVALARASVMVWVTKTVMVDVMVVVGSRLDSASARGSSAAMAREIRMMMLSERGLRCGLEMGLPMIRDDADGTNVVEHVWVFQVGELAWPNETLPTKSGGGGEKVRRMNDPSGQASMSPAGI